MNGQDRDRFPQPPTFDPPRGVTKLNGLLPVFVICPEVTAQSLIFLSIRNPSGSLGATWVVAGSVVPGTGFSVSTIALNVSDIAWLVLEP